MTVGRHILQHCRNLERCLVVPLDDLSHRIHRTKIFHGAGLRNHTGIGVIQRRIRISLEQRETKYFKESGVCKRYAWFADEYFAFLDEHSSFTGIDPGELLHLGYVLLQGRTHGI